jgi:hypothetical protein
MPWLRGEVERHVGAEFLPLAAMEAKRHECHPEDRDAASEARRSPAFRDPRGAGSEFAAHTIRYENDYVKSAREVTDNTSVRVRLANGVV